MSFKIKYEDFVKTYCKKYRSSIYYPKILEKYKQNKNIIKISKSFDIPYQTVWRWVNNKSIPVPFVEYQKIKKEFNETEIKDLAIIIGHIFGDGGIISNGRVHYCNTEQFLINEFISQMSKIFENKPHIRKEAKITRVENSSLIGKTLWCIFGKFSFGKDTKIITLQIQKMSLKWKAKMLQAWFNDDGSVPNYGVISIKQKLKPLILFIQDTLSELGIKSQISEDNGKWLLRICSYKYMQKFKEKIGFSEDYRKKQKLNELLEKIKFPHFKIKNKILKLLKESPKTRKELKKSLDIKEGTIYGHLHGWKRKSKTEKTNIGLIDMGFVEVKKRGRINVYVIKSNKFTKN